MKGNPTLPHELIVEILLRLPVRSLLRFKCVCKSWLSLISSDPQFAKSHFDLAASPTHRLVLNLTSDDGKKIKSLDLELSFHDDSSILNLNFPPPLPPNEYTIALSGGNNGIEILGSCRGFMLLSNHKGDLVVWNPATGFHRKISDFGYSYMDFLYGIGYDSSKDDYLIVFIQLVHKPNAIGWPTQILYFSLKTNSWSDPQLIEVQYTNSRKDFQPGSLLNETLHWSVISYDEKLDVIIAFDLIERSLFEIPLPHDLALELTYEYYHLRVMGGCLSICYSGGSGAMAEIWMMKEYKVQSSWTKSYVISTHDIPRNIFLPMCFTKCGGIFGSNGHGSLVKFNDKGELLEHCKYLREKGAYCLIHCGMYRESLLSLP